MKTKKAKAKRKPAHVCPKLPAVPLTMLFAVDVAKVGDWADALEGVDDELDAVDLNDGKESIEDARNHLQDVIAEMREGFEFLRAARSSQG